MNYFVTGATGFIGHNLVRRLLQREGTIYALVRAGSRGRLEELRTSFGPDGARVVPVDGDLAQAGLGVSEEDLLELRGKVDHFFHLAAIYDMKAKDPAHSFEENGERFSVYFLRAKTKEDLVRRMNLHRAIADMSHGLLGRSPDHVSSFVTGMAMNPMVFGKYADNLTRYYEHMRHEDVYGVYAVIPPQAARNPEFYVKQNLPIPTLRVVREDDDGVVISGMKMLATGAVFAATTVTLTVAEPELAVPSVIV